MRLGLATRRGSPWHSSRRPPRSNQLNSGAAQLVAANAAFESKARRFVLLLAGFAFVAGVVGGFVGANLAGI
ncbi:hypothetical protein [Xanthomonas oryzae]|uniref:hypothetical protein n=1 Tax=Xanthomonas oryzae TaxID=347 RepID=UPI000DD59987|nr:hypothetical protein [Xanthomonas oryzae]RBA49988.1 hypothetical protein BRO16_22520 [Xanthomonas oryzae pv. oryzae]RBE42327.1 hypothetical protein BRL77_21780 [Xanthomonas oryzae pv. oryzae]RBE94612.1 hypothetical protein BRM91_21245 [Xanthomonas oryzae pv. oryzae]RBI37920.1 hypothetical protein BRL68_22655 [Xanthomonas oryzae pv. oryzae]RBK63058.1 hypothetical protein BRN49_14105 [Xanthomonas oryzae pv. oryzae]